MVELMGDTSRRSTKRRAARLFLVAMLCALCLPATALAGQDDIFSGWLGTSGAYGPRHSLNSVWATWYDGYNACVNAWNDGGGWAGSSVCAYPGDTNRGHGYCACQLRYGFGASNNSWGYWRQFW